MTRADYMENVFEPLYNLPIESIHPHRIALFFTIIGDGLATEPGEVAS